MAFETVLTDGIAHASGGLVLALLDFISSKVVNPSATRIEQKKQCLRAIEVILDAEQPQAEETAEAQRLAKDSVEYAAQIATVRDYLRTSGLVKLNVPLFVRLSDGVKNIVKHEKINVLTNPVKLGIATGIEILYDIGQLTSGKTGLFPAIGSDLYQIPCFFAGLWVGNLLKKVINAVITPNEEREIDETIQQLLKETSLIDLIVNYTPPEAVQQALGQQGIQVYTSQLTRAGKSAYKQLAQFAGKAKDVAGDMVNLAQKHEEQTAQERDERKKRFDELTKGR